MRKRKDDQIRKILIYYIGLFIFLVILCLLTSCLQPVTTATQESAQSARQAVATLLPVLEQTKTTTPPTQAVFQCAQVSAIQTLNVRNDKRSVIGQLHHGERVAVITSAGDWWMIRSAKYSGQVRAKYLTECKGE